MQTTQLELPRTDYGITDAKKSTDVAEGTTKKLLYWRYKDTPTLSSFTCCDVHYAPTSAGATLMGFELTSCAALAGSPWDPLQKLAMFTNDSGITFAAVTTTTTGACFSYGHSTAAARGMITITAQSAVAIKTAGGVAMTSYTACLPNLHQLTIISS